MIDRFYDPIQAILHMTLWF